MRLLDLPPELMGLVLGLVPTRSLLSCACACRELRAAAGRIPLRVCMTSQTSDNIMPWLSMPSVAPRVVSLVLRNVFRDPWDPSYAFLEAFTELRVLVVSFCRMRPGFFRFLPPMLEHLDVHMVSGPSVFLTSRVQHLTRLRVLSLVFAPHVDLVSVAGLGSLPLERLEIHRAQGVTVREPLVVPDLRIHAVDSLACEVPLTARTLILRCDASPVPLEAMLPRASMASLRCLSVSCPGVSSVPGLEDATALTRLAVRLDVAAMSLSQLRGLRELRELDVRAAYGVCVSGDGGGLHDDTRVSVGVGGVPWPAQEVRSLFNMPGV